MKQFFKYMFASMLGFLLSLFIFFFIIIIIMASAISFSSGDEVHVPDNTLLQVRLDIPIVERAPKSPFDGFTPFGGGVRPLGLNQIVSSIENAAKDKRIKGLYLEMGVMQAGIGTVEEIRNALLKFRESGKPIIAYGDQVSQRSYYLATVADKIYVNPIGGIDFSGLTAQVAFFKGLGEKLKVEMQIIRPGSNEFKSAVEPFFLDRMSEANRTQTARYIQSGWDHMLMGISEGRKLDTAGLNLMADSLIAIRSSAALSHGLIDGTLFKDQLLDTLRSMLNLKPRAKINTLTIAKYHKAVAKSLAKKGGTKGASRIAVIYASGNIVMGDAEEMVISADHMSKTIRKAREDKNIKAIVLRVNSGGGDGIASEIIWREVALASKVKPVVVSMGDYAASGGYYIACAASKIVAQPTTLTGSIGVFGVMPNLQKLFNDHLGITFDEVNTNRNSSVGNVMRPLSPFEYNLLKGYVEDFYTHFTGRVAEGRNLEVAFVDSIGQGRIWSGTDALGLGLVDALGGLNDAVALAAKEAGIETYTLLEWPVQQDPFMKMMKQLSGEAAVQKNIRETLGTGYVWYELLASVNDLKGVQARLPFLLTIH